MKEKMKPKEMSDERGMRTTEIETDRKTRRQSDKKTKRYRDILTSRQTRLTERPIYKTSDAGSQYRCGRVGWGIQPPSTPPGTWALRWDFGLDFGLGP